MVFFAVNLGRHPGTPMAAPMSSHDVRHTRGERRTTLILPSEVQTAYWRAKAPRLLPGAM